MLERTRDETVAMQHLAQTVPDLHVKSQQLPHLLPQVRTQPVREDSLRHQQAASSDLQSGMRLLGHLPPPHLAECFGPVLAVLHGEIAGDLFLDESIDRALGHGLLEGVNGLTVEKGLVVFCAGILKVHAAVDQQHFVKLLPIRRPNQLEITRKGSSEVVRYLPAPSILLHSRKRLQNATQNCHRGLDPPGGRDAGAQRGEYDLVAEVKVVVDVRDYLGRGLDRGLFLGTVE